MSNALFGEYSRNGITVIWMIETSSYAYFTDNKAARAAQKAEAEENEEWERESSQELSEEEA